MNKHDEVPLGIIVAVWLAALVVGLAFWGVVIWGIVEIVQWLTAQ